MKAGPTCGEVEATSNFDVPIGDVQDKSAWKANTVIAGI